MIFKTIALMLILFASLFANKNTNEKTNNLSFSYDNHRNKFNITNRSLFKFSNDIKNLTLYAQNQVDHYLTYENDTKQKRFLSFFTNYFINSFLNFDVGIHEFGHASRLRALGYKTQFNNNLPYNLHEYYFLNKKNFMKDAYVESTGNRLYEVHRDVKKTISTTENSSTDFDIVISAAGITNDVKYSELINDRLIWNDGSPFDFLDYIEPKLSAYIYIATGSWLDSPEFSDTLQLEKYFQARDWNIKENDIGNSSLIAFFLSSSTYIHGLNSYNYLLNGDRKTQNLFYKNFRLPDVSSYYERGISYKLISGYKLSNNLYVPISIEKVFKGDTKRKEEISIGIHIKPANNLLVKTNITKGGAIQDSLEIEYDIQKHIQLFASMESNDIRNISGLRDISSLKYGYKVRDYYFGVKIIF